MMNLMNKKYLCLAGYTTQYLDLLNFRFLQMSEEKRLKSISIMAKRLVEQDNEYKLIRSKVMAVAEEHKCSVMDISLNWISLTILNGCVE
jgi:hypothetical protein